MADTIFRFVSRGEQVRLRGLRNYAHWLRITKGHETLSPAARKRLFEQQAEDEAKDREWVQRHHPLPGGGVVLPFRRELVEATILWESSAGEKTGG
jgi:hypothetical protein